MKRPWLRRRQRKTLWLGLFVAAWTSIGCLDAGPATSQPEPSSAVAHHAAAKEGAAAAGPSHQSDTARPYVYSSFNRRDPFESYLTTLREREAADRETQPRRETENYDASQYRLTAIISGTSRPSAMVEDPTGKGFVLRIGDTIGKHMGRITNIDATGVSYVERLYDGSGQPMQAPNVLRLPPTEDLADALGTH